MFDLIIIGAGPGGYEAAIKAAKENKTVALIEKRDVGGTCLHRGCIPTKTLLHITNMYKQQCDSHKFGIYSNDVHIDYEKLWQHKEETLHKLSSGLVQELKKKKITIIEGTGCIKNSNHVVVETKDGISSEYETKNILIASGSMPSLPPIKGVNLPNVYTSDSIFDENKLGSTTPFSSIVIIGGGVIGMEMATVYSNIGSDVTVIEGTDKILPNFDKEVSQNLKMIMKKRNVSIITNSFVQEIKEVDGMLECTYSVNGELSTSQSEGVLVSVGRKPNTEGLFKDEIKDQIVFNCGCIQVDNNYQTTLPNVYAIGDVIGGIQLAHVASNEGVSAVNAMFHLDQNVNREIIPSCVYTNPEIASCGLTVEEAKKQNIDVITGKYIMSVNGKSVLGLEERGFIKIIACAKTRKILGCSMMCARATDMIGEISLAIVNGLTIEQLKKVIRAHPTYEEGISGALESIK